MILSIIVLLLGLTAGLSGQHVDVDSINFYNDSLFEINVFNTNDGQLDFIEYKQLNGDLKKIDFYDSDQRIKKHQIWNTELVEQTDYTYFENNQIIKRYDALNKIQLATEINVNIHYPAMARENQIEGIIEIALNYNEDCIPSSFKIQNTLGHGIDEEVEKKMKLMIALAQKYKAVFEECGHTNEHFKINFMLE